MWVCFELTATDAVDPNLELYITDSGSGHVFGRSRSGTSIKYVQAPGAEPSQKASPGMVDWVLRGTGDAILTAVEGSGIVSAPVACLVAPPPK